MVKVSLFTSLKRMGNGDVAPRILNLGTTWRVDAVRGRSSLPAECQIAWARELDQRFCRRDIWPVRRIESRLLRCPPRRVLTRRNELSQHQQVKR